MTTLYLRVSTAAKSQQGGALTFDQNPDVHEQPLRELATQRGWSLLNVHQDRASGAKERRPGLDGLMRDGRRGEFELTAAIV